MSRSLAIKVRYSRIKLPSVEFKVNIKEAAAAKLVGSKELLCIFCWEAGLECSIGNAHNTPGRTLTRKFL